MNPTDFRDVREQLTATAQVPDLDIVYRLGNRRRSYVHSAAAFGVVIVLVAAALIGVNLLVARHDRVPLGPRPTLPAPVHGSLRGAAVDLDRPPPMWQLATVNSYQAYALLANKARQVPVIARTFDAGSSWQAWRLPAPMVELLSLWPVSGQTLYALAGAGGHKTASYLSRDGGESWTPMPAAGPPVDGVPPGWDLMLYGTPSGSGGLDRPAMYAVDPATNMPHRLAQQPPPAVGDNVSRLDALSAADGSLWMHGGCASDLTFPAVSRDRGVSWHSARQPMLRFDAALDQGMGRSGPPGTDAAVDSSCVVAFDSPDGKTGYATVDVSKQNQFTTSSRLFTTRDGGKSWTFVPQEQPRLLGAVLVAPGGALLAVDRTNSKTPIGKLVISHDGGRTFQPVAGIGLARNLRRSTSGQLLVDSVFGASGNAYWPMLSLDGTKWTRTATPPNAQWVE